jgi:hypothetical protein
VSVLSPSPLGTRSMTVHAGPGTHMGGGSRLSIVATLFSAGPKLFSQIDDTRPPLPNASVNARTRIPGSAPTPDVAAQED